MIEINKKQGKPVFPKQISYLMRIRDVSEHLDRASVKNKWLIKIGIYYLKFINNILSSYVSNKENDVTLSTVDKFDENFDKFWGKVKCEYDFIIEGSKEYMNWRYTDKRGGNYRITIAFDDNEIVGYLVTRIIKYKPDYYEGFIVDFLALFGRNDVVEKMILDAIRYFDENDVNVIYCWIIRGHLHEKIFFLRVLLIVESRSK